MAQYGEWNRKGATLSDVTARKEYGVDREFIIQGIEAGKLEYRHGSVHGAPYIRLLRSQLEAWIAESLGPDRLLADQRKTELKKVKKEISELKARLMALTIRKVELEIALGKSTAEKPEPVRKRR
jgi:hypothetical protein